MARTGTPASDDALVIALASGATIDEAAEASGLSRRTVYRRMEDAKFAGRVEEARRTFTARSLHRLLSLREKHVRLIDAIANPAPTKPNPADPTNPIPVEPASEGVRLNASKAIIELGSKLRVEHDLEERIRAIEQRLAAKEGTGAA